MTLVIIQSSKHTHTHILVIYILDWNNLLDSLNSNQGIEELKVLLLNIIIQKEKNNRVLLSNDNGIINKWEDI